MAETAPIPTPTLVPTPTLTSAPSHRFPEAVVMTDTATLAPNAICLTGDTEASVISMMRTTIATGVRTGGTRAQNGQGATAVNVGGPNGVHATGRTATMLDETLRTTMLPV